MNRYKIFLKSGETVEVEALKPETGHWIMHQDHRECSKCGIYFLKDMPRNSYCPNCGTRMTKSEEVEK